MPAAIADWALSTTAATSTNTAPRSRHCHAAKSLKALAAIRSLPPVVDAVAHPSRPAARENQPAPNTVPSFSGANGIPAVIARGTTTSA